MRTPWSHPEDFGPPVLNELGNKFWADAEMQGYANSKGVSIQCLFVETVDGKKSRIIGKDDKALFENTSMEAVACHIDILAAGQEFIDQIVGGEAPERG